MGETASVEKTPKTSFFKGLKAEFNKVVWPDQETITKQTIAVVSVGLALGLIIAALDLVMKIGVERLLMLAN